MPPSDGPTGWSPEPAPWSTTPRSTTSGWSSGRPGPWPPAGPGRPLPEPPRRRRPRSVRVLPWLIVLTLAAVYGSRWLPHLQVGADGAFSLVGGGLPLPAATDRTYPRPGVEELETRLVPAVTTVDPGTGYAFQETQTDAAGVTVPVAWSPCRPVHLVVDPTGAPADFLTVVTAAAAEVSAATGLVLVVDGTTTEAAAPEREAYLPEQYGDRWAPALVRFTDDATVPGLAGDVVGLAGVQIVRDPTADRSFLVSGTVYLDSTLLADPSATTWYPAVLRHELGHLVGLDHVADPAQLMYPTTTVQTFQPGDLAGLALLGRGACAPGI